VPRFARLVPPDVAGSVLLAIRKTERASDRRFQVPCDVRHTLVDSVPDYFAAAHNHRADIRAGCGKQHVRQDIADAGTGRTRGVEADGDQITAARSAPALGADISLCGTAAPAKGVAS
jgi:hypothetical protein